MARVKSAAPELAARYADIIEAGTEGKRASAQGESPAVIWGNEK
jgi:hypothetical protein